MTSATAGRSSGATWFRLRCLAGLAGLGTLAWLAALGRGRVRPFLPCGPHVQPWRPSTLFGINASAASADGPVSRVGIRPGRGCRRGVRPGGGRAAAGEAARHGHGRGHLQRLLRDRRQHTGAVHGQRSHCRRGRSRRRRSSATLESCRSPRASTTASSARSRSITSLAMASPRRCPKRSASSSLDGEFLLMLVNVDWWALLTSPHAIAHHRTRGPGSLADDARGSRLRDRGTGHQADDDVFSQPETAFLSRSTVAPPHAVARALQG